MWTLKQGAMAAAVAFVSVLPLGATGAQAAAISPGVLASAETSAVNPGKVVQVRRRGGRFRGRGLRRGRVFRGRGFRRHRRFRRPRFRIFVGPRYYRPYRRYYDRRCFRRYYPIFFSRYCRRMRRHRYYY